MPAQGRWPWTLGALAALAHAAAAFQWRYGWSHAAARADIARQTAAASGLDWGGGLYVNYAFLALWTADCAWWWWRPATFRARARAVDFAVRAFLLFIFVNGAVVFGHGPVRLVGAIAALAVVAAWYGGRRAKGVGEG
jgi:hypothetical protein